MTVDLDRVYRTGLQFLQLAHEYLQFPVTRSESDGHDSCNLVFQAQSHSLQTCILYCKFKPAAHTLTTIISIIIYNDGIH